MPALLLCNFPEFGYYAPDSKNEEKNSRKNRSPFPIDFLQERPVN